MTASEQEAPPAQAVRTVESLSPVTEVVTTETAPSTWTLGELAANINATSVSDLRALLDDVPLSQRKRLLYAAMSSEDADVRDDAALGNRREKQAFALRVLEGALLADEVKRHDKLGTLPSSCEQGSFEDSKEDLDDDDIIVFHENSFSEDDDDIRIQPDRIQHVPDLRATASPFLNRVHVRVTDAMGAARNGMSYLGDRWEAFGFGLDDAAEKYTHQLEHMEGVVKVKMSTISGKTYATFKILDTTANKCRQRLEVGADLVSGKARVLSEAARVKAGGLTSSKMAKNGRTRLKAARDKMHASLSTQTRSAWHSWKVSVSRGGA
jgi:hypothetical protein